MTLQRNNTLFTRFLEPERVGASCKNLHTFPALLSATGALPQSRRERLLSAHLGWDLSFQTDSDVATRALPKFGLSRFIASLLSTRGAQTLVRALRGFGRGVARPHSDGPRGNFKRA